MASLKPSTRLKVKGDTFFLPDPNGGVYFRNNTGSFRLEGAGIDQWIEKLIPVLNGEYSLDELTDGLPDEYRDQVYEISEMLYQNGFARDVSQDRPHQLPDKILEKHASEIEFLDNVLGSGAYRFQCYREEKVLAIGSGPFFVSLVAALLETGLPRFHVLITDSMPTNRERLAELAAHGRKTDPEVEIGEITLQSEGENPWQEAVQPFHSVLYVSQEGNVEELKRLQAVCRKEGKVLFPAIFAQQIGLAGPLIHPEADGCWESAWRRIHQSAVTKDPQLHTFSSTAGAMLANVVVFELLKMAAGVTPSELTNQVFLLDLETLEENWYPFIPHPLVTGDIAAKWVEDLDQRLKQSSESSKSSQLLPYFSSLTSMETGILHVWEEGDLKQLPLALCRVQAVDPLSEGPAMLLPEVVCSGLTHEEVRGEAGLTGIEAYVSRLVGPLLTPPCSEQNEAASLIAPEDFVGVGAGGTAAEAICRGLQKCLTEELGRQMVEKQAVSRVQLDAVEDERCRFYLQALTTMKGAPAIGWGADISGFPVVWVGTEDCWYGSVGLNLTLALRNALQQALLHAQNPAAYLTQQALSTQMAHLTQTAHLTTQALEASSVHLGEQMKAALAIPSCEPVDQSELLQSALQILKQNQMRLMVLDLALEPFLQEELAGVFGVLLRKEESA